MIAPGGAARAVSRAGDLIEYNFCPVARTPMPHENYSASPQLCPLYLFRKPIDTVTTVSVHEVNTGSVAVRDVDEPAESFDVFVNSLVPPVNGLHFHDDEILGHAARNVKYEIRDASLKYRVAGLVHFPGQVVGKSQIHSLPKLVVEFIAIHPLPVCGVRFAGHGKVEERAVDVPCSGNDTLYEAVNFAIGVLIVFVIRHRSAMITHSAVAFTPPASLPRCGAAAPTPPTPPRVRRNPLLVG